MNKINFARFQSPHLAFGSAFLILFTLFTVDAQKATSALKPATPPLIRGVRPESQQDMSTNQSYWAIENAGEREKLPLYLTIPAATPEELTPADGYPKRETFLTWHRSLRDNGSARYFALDQINRQNVTHLQVAWIYHSKVGRNYTECNPIIVRHVMFMPMPGKFIVAVNAENGQELWRFKPESGVKPEGRPAFRGLIYWSGGIFTLHSLYLNRIENEI